MPYHAVNRELEPLGYAANSKNGTAASKQITFWHYLHKNQDRGFGCGLFA